MFLGDSRSLEGCGLLPAQDHRKDVKIDERAVRICVRIVDQRKRLGQWVHDKDLVGDLVGLAVWPQIEGQRPMAAWRHVFPCVVARRGIVPTGNTGGGGGGGNAGSSFLGPAGEIPEDSRTAQLTLGG